MSETNDIAEIRRAVQALCAEFPGEYWREKDAARAYPGEFVDALTKAGFLAALIGLRPAPNDGSLDSLRGALRPAPLPREAPCPHFSKETPCSVASVPTRHCRTR